MSEDKDSRKTTWDDLPVTGHSWPSEGFNRFHFGQDSPWLVCEKDGLQVVVNAYGFIHETRVDVAVGVDFLAMIESYKETFLVFGSGDTAEDRESKRLRTIECLSKAISILCEVKK